MPYLTHQQIVTLSFLVVASLMLLISPAHAVGGRYCKIDHYHSGSGDIAPTLAQAKASAGRSWSSFTSWEYGRQWGNISLSLDKNYKCEHPTTGWKCSVTAKPCKSDLVARKTRKKTSTSYRKRRRTATRRSRARRTTRYSRKARHQRKRRYSHHRSSQRKRTLRKSRYAKAKKWTMKW